MAGSFKDFMRQLTRSYRLSVSDLTNYSELYVASVSRLKLWVLILGLVIVVVALVVVSFFYTPLKYQVPGYPSNDLRKMMYYNSMMLDSLQKEIDQRDRYLAQIQEVIEGGVVKDTLENNVDDFEGVTMSPMQNDSMFSELIGPDKYKFSHTNSETKLSDISRLNLFSPVRGVVVNTYDAFSEHYGVDVVGNEFSHIVSVLDGTVIFAEWSVTTGYVVAIQHAQNLISIYKHNSNVLVKSGEHISAGDLIAIMGNEGEYSTGPHLHFELWQNGVPLDPENYILF